MNFGAERLERHRHFDERSPGAPLQPLEVLVECERHAAVLA
jgi:hypothetical protein